MELLLIVPPVDMNILKDEVRPLEMGICITPILINCIPF